ASSGRSLPARHAVGHALLAAAVAPALTGCQGSGTGVEVSASDGTAAGTPDGGKNSSDGKRDDGPRRLLWMGDSIGEAQAPALGAAMKAGGVAFRSVAAAGGGGGVVGEIAAPTWDGLPKTRPTARTPPPSSGADCSSTPWAPPCSSRAWPGLPAHRPGASSPPLRRLGTVSYSLYLWHWPVHLLLSEERLGLEGAPRTAVLLAVSVALAVLSKVLVEDPVRFRVRWAKGRTGAVALVAAFAALAALAALWAAVPQPRTGEGSVDVTRLGPGGG
ncbi:acyltransferase, partial [Streptomyces sp. E5N91]|uniref:acyltransferase family protein n=1 Tax=Streptomyces sp. E5N91 TaxID=1851996 RepID=UPI001EE9271B